MKKILLFLSFLLMSIGVFCTEVLYKETIFNSINNSGNIGSYTNSWYNTTNGFRVNISNANNNNNNWKYIKFGRKDNASTGTIITNTVIDKKVTKVGIDIDAITVANITSITLYTSTNGSTWTSRGIFTKSIGTQYDEIYSENQAENLYYKIEFVCQSGSSNGLIQISHVYFYTEDDEHISPCDSITLALSTLHGSANLSKEKICKEESIKIINIIPDDGYELDTIMCIDEYGNDVGSVNHEMHVISDIDKNCYVLVMFKEIIEPHIDVAVWDTGYVKITIDNFNAATALLEDKDTQHIQEEKVADSVFFSKYFEAASNVKLLGIYNGTNHTVDLSDYELWVDNDDATGWKNKKTIGALFTQYEIESSRSILSSGSELILIGFQNSMADSAIIQCAKDSSNSHYETYIRIGQWIDFNGDDAVALVNSEGNIIDLIGAGTKTNGRCLTGGDVVTTNNNDGNVNGFMDKPGGWYTEKGYKSNNDNTEESNYKLSSNRCLLIRRNHVKSGLNAVQRNTTKFLTLGDYIYNDVNYEGEWKGIQIPGKTSEGGATASCNGFNQVGSYDYNTYYAQFTEIVSDTALSQIIDSDSTYKFTYNFTDLSCTELKVIVKDTTDKNNIKTREEIFRIPIFIYNDSTVKSFKEKNCRECDVIIMGGGKLTINSELTNRDVTVYPGGVLIIPSNQTYNVNSLTLRRDNDSVPYFSYKGTLNTNEFNIDLRTNAEDWRWMTLPFSHKISNITYPNGKKPILNNEIFLEFYDGEYRAQYKSGAWKFHNYNDIFNAGEGFLFGVDLPGQSKKIYRFSFNKDSVEHEKSDKIIKNLYAWGGNNENLAPNHKGWNLIGNPFMDSDTTDIIDPIRIGRLKKDSVNGRWTGGWVVDSITTKLRYAVIPNKEEEFADAGYYESVVLDDYVLQPLTSFFIQIGGNENDMQTLTFKPEKRTNKIVARRTPINERDEELFLRIKIGDKKTGCFISNHFNENYEPGDDLESRYAYYQLINGYKLLYSAINDSIIENGVQIHSLGGKVTLDPKVETDKFEQIYILYNNEWYDLLHGDEPEVSGDFVLYGKRKINEDIPTDIGNIKPGQGTYKFLHENNIFINNKGKIYNVLGSSIQ